jgi:concanavalin A-like lectin/glucanase superfamily protein/K319-like protein
MLLLLATAATSCLTADPTQVVVRVVNEDGAPVPQYLRFSWYTCTAFVLRGSRVPETGDLAPTGEPIASIIVSLDGATASRRGIFVKGMVDGAAISNGLALVDPQRAKVTEVTVRLLPGAIPEMSEDSLPRALAGCRGGAVPGDASTADTSSTASADGGGPDRGGPDAARPADGALVPDAAAAPEGGHANTAPVVSAGADQTAPTLATELMLAGTASDDGLPAPARLTLSWSQVSGPGSTTFSDAALPATRARFSAPGAYVLRLTASDGEMAAHADVTATVLTLDDGLAGLWHFDEGAGTTAMDSSGGGNHATLAGSARWVAGRIGKSALECPGAGARAILDDPASGRLDFGAGDFTAAAWVRTTRSTGEPNILVKWPVSGSAGPPNGFALGLTGGLALFKGFSNPTGQVRVIGPAVSDGQWHHLVGRKTAGTMALFVDGQMAAMLPHTLATFSNDEQLKFGGYSTNTTYDLDGQLDEVILYARALSDREIAALAAGLGP